MRSAMIGYALGGGAILAVGAGVAIERNPDLLAPSIRDLLEKLHATAVVGAPAATAALAPAPVRPSPEPPPAAATAPAPEFDIVRVEPNGEAVVAGRAAPRAQVELRDDDHVLASVAANDAGLFVIVPEPLAAGSHRLRLAARVGDGEAQLSVLSSVEVAPQKDALAPLAAAKQPTAAMEPAAPRAALAAPARPAATLPPTPPVPSPVAAANAAPPISPGAIPPKPPAPTPVLAANAASAVAPAALAPKPPAPSLAVAALTPEAAAKSALAPTPDSTGGSRLAIGSIKPTEPGRLEAEGYADPGMRVRLTLNGAFLAEAVAGPDGLWSLTIERGMKAGLYVLAAEQLGPAGGAQARAQASFAYPENPARDGAPLASARPPASPPIEAAQRSPEPARDEAAPREPAPNSTETAATVVAKAVPVPAVVVSSPTPGSPAPQFAEPGAAPREPALNLTEPAATVVAKAAQLPAIIVSPPASGAPAPKSAEPQAAPREPALNPTETTASATAALTEPAATVVAKAAPLPAIVLSPPTPGAPAPESAEPGAAPTSEPEPSAAVIASPPAPAPTFSDPSHAVVPEVRTTTVVRGDNLWDLARRFYGDGLRYSDIFSANAAQIRNPNLIYIGQVFVVPQEAPPRP